MKDRLKHTRILKGLTLREVEKFTGLSYQQLWQLEDGVQNASISTLEVLSKFYNIPMTELIELNFRNSHAYKNYIALLKKYSSIDTRIK